MSYVPFGTCAALRHFYLRCYLCCPWNFSHHPCRAGHQCGDVYKRQPEEISRNVSDLLDELIEQSVRVVGKPVALMNKEDKVKAIQFLNNSGAFLITKSGDKVCKFFGISKYTLYSYIDEAKEAAN